MLCQRYLQAHLIHQLFWSISFINSSIFSLIQFKFLNVNFRKFFLFKIAYPHCSCCDYIEPNELNFLLNYFLFHLLLQYLFYFLNSLIKFLISLIELIEKQLAPFIVLLTIPVELFQNFNKIFSPKLDMFIKLSPFHS